MISRERFMSQLRRVIRLTLPTIAGEGATVIISGSWHTGDVHLPNYRCGHIRSFSDVDLVSSADMAPCLAVAVRARILEELDRAGLAATGVSLRSRRELQVLPHSAAWNEPRATTPYWREACHGITFWSHIAALEAAITFRRHDDVDRSIVASYVIVKYFFTFARNAALSNGSVLVSYTDLCHWSINRLSGLPMGEALEIKRGTRMILSDRSAQLLLSPTTLRALAPVSDDVCAIAADLLQARTTTSALPADRYEAELASLANTPVLSRVVEHEHDKYQRASVGRA